MHTLFRLVARCAVFVLVAPPLAQAALFSWDAPTGGAFKDPANWIPGAPSAPPGMHDVALFALASVAGYTVTFSQPQTSGALIVKRDRLTLDFVNPDLTWTLAQPGAGMLLGQGFGDVAQLTLRNGRVLVDEAQIGVGADVVGELTIAAGATLEFVSTLRAGGSPSLQSTVEVGSDGELRTAMGLLALDQGARLSLRGGTLATAGSVELDRARLFRDDAGALALAAGGHFIARNRSSLVFEGDSTLAAGTRYTFSGDSLFESDGMVSLLGALELGGARFDASGSDGIAGTLSFPPKSAVAPTAGHDFIVGATGDLKITAGGSLAARGGDGFNGLNDAGSGAGGGHFQLRGGSVAIGDGAWLDLRGGDGGDGSLGDGGRGGSGGWVSIDGGSFALIGAGLRVDGGAGGQSLVGNDGQRGDHGGLSIDGGGVLALRAARIGASAGPATPTSIVDTRLVLGNGTLSLLDDTLVRGGTLTAIETSVVALASGIELTLGAGADWSFANGLQVAAGNRFALEDASVLNLRGALSIEGHFEARRAAQVESRVSNGRGASTGSGTSAPRAATAGQIGDEIVVAAPEASFVLEAATARMNGGTGGNGAQIFRGAAGGVGGQLRVDAGLATLRDGALLDLRGGQGGYGVFVAQGGIGGDGGALVVTGGRLLIDDATVLLGGGAGGGADILDDERPGFAGRIDLQGGETELRAARVLGNRAAVGATPLELTDVDLLLGGGLLDTRAGSLLITEAALRQSGGRFVASTIELGSGGRYVFSGGTLAMQRFIGNLTQTGGQLSPGQSPGLSVIDGDYRLGAAASLLLELGGDVRGSQYDALDVGGVFRAGGTLEVVLIDGYDPAAGTRFDLFDFASLVGGFDQVLLPALGAGRRFDTSQLLVTGEITVVPLPPAGLLLITAAVPLLTLSRRRRPT